MFRRFAYWRRARQTEVDLAEEIETHRRMTEDRLRGSGMPVREAEIRSRRIMGNVTLAREDARSIWIGPSFERLCQDVRHGVRLLWRNPVFTFVAVMTLALGIGANATMFSVVNAVLLRPLPYRDPDRLVMIWSADPRRNIHEAGTSFPTVTDWRSRSRHVTDMAIWAQAATRIHTGPDRQRVLSAFVSANMFSVLGVDAAIGRTFSHDEEQRRERVVVLSHAFWQRQFGANPDVLDRSIDIDSETPEGFPEPTERVRIIGVMPADFFFPTREVQVWQPATLLGIHVKPKLYDRQWTDRFIDRWSVVGRLAPDSTVRSAHAELTNIGGQLATSYPVPAGHDGFPGFGVEVVPALDQLTGKDLGLALWILLGAVGCVLIIACANVANLLLARGTTRQRELAIRAALGAGRGRLARQLLIESGMLALGGGLIGAAVAVAGVRVLAAAAVAGIPRLDEIAVDTPVLAFTAAVSILAGIAFGLVPALKAARAGVSETLTETTSTASGNLRIRHTRSLLVIVECALAVILLTGAGLLARSLLRLQAVDPGLNPAGVLLVRIDLPIPVSPTWRQQEWLTFGEINERVARLPGVIGSGLVQNFLIASSPRTPITVEGKPVVQEPTATIGVNSEEVTPGFFQAIGVPLRAGRFFTSEEQNAPVAIVNDAFARRFFPDEDPIGRRFRQGTGTKVNWVTIVGVVGNMRRQGLERESIPEFFIPSTEPTMDLAIRVAGPFDPASIAASVRHEIRAAYPGAIVGKMIMLDELMGERTAERRYQTWLLGVFAALATILSAIGMYGVMQFAISQRTREIGIRIALGASVSDVMRMVLRQGMMLPLVGMSVGLGGAFLLTRVLERLLFGVTATDPITFAAVAILLLCVTLVACYLPARKASKVDPVVVLRAL